MFSPLTTDDLGQIVSLYIDRLETRLAERRLQLAVTPDARAWLAERGFDPIYGARPLRRLMQHEIDDRLARALLAGDVRDGDTVMVGSSATTSCRCRASRTRLAGRVAQRLAAWPPHGERGPQLRMTSRSNSSTPERSYADFGK